VHQVRTVAGPPAARVRAAQPVARALLPQWVARLLGLAALACVGALEWQRQIGGYSSARALVWVLAAVAAAVFTLLAGQVRGRWRRAGALTLAVVLAALVGYLVSGAPLHYLKPRHWDELGSGFTDGLQALGTVALPYKSANPWPRIALELLVSGLFVLAGLLTFWPRAAVEDDDARSPLRAPDRGYQIVALAVLLVVIASPVVSLGGTRSLALGLVLSGLTVAFLWLERLPLRPGIGVAALLAAALVGALPLAALADRGEPWFDYRAFAENLGPDDPVHFSWSQTYGPITWPRDGNEVMRVSSNRPLYWKARDLDVFDGRTWRVRTDPTPRDNPLAPTWDPDVADGGAANPEWTSTISVDIRRMQTTDVIGAGTIMQVVNPSHPVDPGLAAGTWDSVGPLHRGDSYTLRVHVPRPNAVALSLAASSRQTRLHTDDLAVAVPFRPGISASDLRTGVETRRVHRAVVHFKGWSDKGAISFASYPSARRGNYDVEAVMRDSRYARTWELAKRLRRTAETPYQYVLAVNRFLRGKEFVYSERPRQPPPGEEPLDFFLNVSHQGYCQHYAGAMALLLRMGGIPARVVTGFSPGGYSSSRKQWIVRDTDAHAWVEAWFDRFGWVTFDPTPAATPARSRIFATDLPKTAASTPVPRATPGGGTSNATRNPEGGFAGGLLGARERAQAGTSTLSTGGGSSLWWLIPVILLALALPALWALALWRSPRGGTPMDRAVAELEGALRTLGRPVRTGTTLSQLERRLGPYSPEVSAYLHALTAGRYAPTPTPPARGGRRALRRALAQGLGLTGRVRALWALPPRVR
jgi:transglutaminase-like putative cysteine protease/FtsH-binding integral membrane protein